MKNTFLLHLLLDAFSVILLGGLHYIYSPVLFSIWSLFFRMINGLGDSGVIYQFRPLAKRLLPSHFTLMNELSVACLCVSLGVGSLISAPLYSKYGFHVVCIMVAGLALFAAILVLFTLSAQ